jgi:tetratricopeptide (TPR) repeat protein
MFEMCVRDYDGKMAKNVIPPHSSMSATDTRELCSRLLVLALALILSSATAAQTAASKTAEIHNHLQKAAEYLKTNDASSAAKEFTAVLALDPKNTEAYTNLGVIAYFQHDYQNASQDLHKALAVNPSSVKAQALLGLCQKELGDPAARATLEKSFSKLKDEPLRIQVGLALADLYDQAGDPGATAVVMKTLVDLDPDNVNVLFMAQRVYSELADDTLNKLAILAPGSARMQQVIAERLINAGDLKGAMEHYKNALQIDPRLPGVHFELGEAILETSPTDLATQADARKEFEAATTLDGDSAKIECALGGIALSQSDSDGAMAHYQRAYRLDPNEVQAQLGLAKLLMAQQKPQEAIKYLRAAVQSDPLNGETHYRLGLACRDLKMTAEAEKEMRFFQEIKQAKDRVKELYRQMNKNPEPSNDETSGTKQPD